MRPGVCGFVCVVLLGTKKLVLQSQNWHSFYTDCLSYKYLHKTFVPTAFTSKTNFGFRQKN